MFNRFASTFALVCSLGITSANAFAIDGENETLVNKVPGTHGGYGASTVGVSRFSDKYVAMSGMRGGWIINHQYVIGLAGYGMSHGVRVTDGGLTRDVNLGYGGLTAEYIAFPDHMVHLHSSMLLGGGALSAEEQSARCDKEDAEGDNPDNCSSNGKRFSVVEPEIMAEMNVTKWFRVGLSASYRLTQGINDFGVSDRDARSPSLGLQVAFGRM